MQKSESYLNTNVRISAIHTEGSLISLFRLVDKDIIRSFMQNSEEIAIHLKYS